MCSAESTIRTLHTQKCLLTSSSSAFGTCHIFCEACIIYHLTTALSATATWTMSLARRTLENTFKSRNGLLSKWAILVSLATKCTKFDSLHNKPVQKHHKAHTIHNHMKYLLHENSIWEQKSLYLET